MKIPTLYLIVGVCKQIQSKESVRRAFDFNLRVSSRPVSQYQRLENHKELTK